MGKASVPRRATTEYDLKDLTLTLMRTAIESMTRGLAEARRELHDLLAQVVLKSKAVA